MASPAASAPEPVTARLALRGLSLDDAPVLAARAGDRRVARYLLDVPSPYPADLARAWLSARMAWWREGRGLTLAITRRDDGPAAPLIGTVSLRQFIRDRRAELGYWIAADAWGQGYATEAAGAALDVAFEHLKLARVYAQVMEGNPGSCRVLTKLGMAHEGDKRQHIRRGRRFVDVSFFGILKDEWTGGADR
jgi:RimJ/RimL family protein N-acetyltransferase